MYFDGRHGNQWKNSISNSQKMQKVVTKLVHICTGGKNNDKYKNYLIFYGQILE